jgi:hypothetical protein
MSILKFLRSLTPLGKVTFALGLVLLLVLAFFAIRGIFVGSAKDEVRLSRNQAEAAVASGTDAVATVGKQMKREEAIDATTRDNTNAIRSAPGADTPISPELDAIARERLCRRAAYTKHPDCLQHAPAP